jgi:hypothetical protein
VGTHFLHVARENAGSWNNRARAGPILKVIYQGRGEALLPDLMADATDLKLRFSRFLCFSAHIKFDAVFPGKLHEFVI